MKKIIKQIIINEMSHALEFPFKKTEEKIAQDIANEYGVKLHFTGTEKLDKIINDALMSNIKNDDHHLTDEQLDYYNSVIYDELRFIGALRD